jgi:Zn-dependent protease
VRQGWDPGQLFLLGLLLFLVPSLLSPGRDFPEPDVIAAYLLSAIIAVTVHEFFHAWSALKFGDDTAFQMNRVNLNPANHFDPLGFIGFVLIALGYPSIAWGKPVPVNFNRLRGDFRQRKFASLVIAGCAPISNVVMAVIATALYRAIERPDLDLGFTGVFLNAFIILNVSLAAFNLIPVPPLDGFRVLSALVPNFWYPVFARLEYFGLFLPFVFIFLDRRLDLGLFDAMVSPGFDLILRLIRFVFSYDPT